MLTYFIVFPIIGFIMGAMLIDMNKVIPIIFLSSLLWGFITVPIWGLVIFGELSFGFYIYMLTNKEDRAMRAKVKNE